jgi:formate dehydrogenase subunit gamma
MTRDGVYVKRFSRTERSVHWIHASAFFVLLGTGLVLYVPRLSTLVARRPLIKDIHVYAAIAWLVLLTIVVVMGDRRGLRRTLRELDLFDDDDRLWLRRKSRPQGRFNAGQKVHAALVAGFAFLFGVSGFLLWLGERDTRFRWASTILLHDGLMYASLILLMGHLYLALIYPATRHALRGIIVGTVRRDWALAHHRKWIERDEQPQ